MLVSNDPHHNLKAVMMMGEIYSWPESAVRQLKFDEPYDSLLMIFVTPYLNYFRTKSQEVEAWLKESKLRCCQMQHCMWALANIFADHDLATDALTS